MNNPRELTSAELRSAKISDAAASDILTLDQCKSIMQTHIAKGILECMPLLNRTRFHGPDLVSKLEATFVGEKAPIADLFGDLWYAEYARLRRIEHEGAQ